MPEIAIPWFSTTFFSQESQNASLAPSRLSINREEPIYSWQDVVTCARNSVCYDNDIGSISTISNAPEPFKNYNEPIYEVPKVGDGTRRHTIRQVMMKAKNINLSAIEEVMPPKVISPTLPKNIPPEILDDVQLFDFYYKNLDSIFIGDGENVTARSSISSEDPEKRVSGNRISRLLSFGQLPRSKLNSIDETGDKIDEKEER